MSQFEGCFRREAATLRHRVSLLLVGLGLLGSSRGKLLRGCQIGGQALPQISQPGVEELVGRGRALERPIQARHQTVLPLFDGIVHRLSSSW